MSKGAHNLGDFYDQDKVGKALILQIRFVCQSYHDFFLTPSPPGEHPSLGTRDLVGKIFYTFFLISNILGLFNAICSGQMMFVSQGNKQTNRSHFCVTFSSRIYWKKYIFPFCPGVSTIW